DCPRCKPKYYRSQISW
ncbi:ompA family protein, partial [Vibrio parahaemolyticus EKP-028]